MKSIEIEEDVYQHLLSNTSRLGESASEILRRLLNLTGKGEAGIGVNRAGKGGGLKKSAATSTGRQYTGALAFIQEAGFQAQTDVVGRFLYILSWLHGQSPDDFSKILSISGKRRKYFARSGQELDASGSSVYPKQIPGTGYWVVTNNDTPKKGRILGDVMRLLGYSKPDIEEALMALT